MATARIIAWSMAIAAALLALLAGTPLRADEPPVPRIYPQLDSDYSPPTKERAIIARQRQSFLADLARCDAGELVSCTALGIAVRTGNGQPQNRPVAELLFRQACDGGEPKACQELSDLLRFAAVEGHTPESAALLGRACDGGMVGYCAEYAQLIEDGVGRMGDLAAADDLRRAACARGSTRACAALVKSLTGARRSTAHREEARAVAARLCEQGEDTYDCETAKRPFGPVWRTSSAALHADFRAACDEGDAWACTELGKEELLLRDGPDAAAITARALALFDRGCTATYDACALAGDLREQEVLAGRCNAGERDACRTLAALYEQRAFSPGDIARAQTLLAGLCDTARNVAERRQTCRSAGLLLLGAAKSDEPYDPATADALLRRSCEAGETMTCLELAEELVSGKRLPQDRARGYALLQDRCDTGFGQACRWLVNSLARDPGAPLLAAGDEYAPDKQDDWDSPLTSAAGQAPVAAPECHTTTVSYRGEDYTDTVCAARYGVTAGSVVERGKAPWQALIWRPERIGTKPVPASARVKCGGTVIRTGWVLTAAHCLTDEDRDIKTAGHRLRLGVSNPNANEGISYRILETHTHPSYTGEKPFYWDIALIRYDPDSGLRTGPAFAPKTVATDPRPIALRPILPATPAYVFGWGRTQVKHGPIPTSLLRGTVLLRTMDGCQRFVRARPETVNAVLCADRYNLQQACSGDSGGPLIIFEPGPQGAKTPVVIGVISSGKECGTAGNPSRFTRLAHPDVQKWLTSVLTGASPPPKAR